MSDSFKVLNQHIDVSDEYGKLENQFFVADETVSFDAVSGTGTLRWKRYGRKIRMAFDQIVVPLEETKSWEFPPEYAQDPTLNFDISFVTPRTIRVRMNARPISGPESPSIMLDGEPASSDAWKMQTGDGKVVWQGPNGSLTLVENPWRLEFRDASSKLLTDTRQMGDTKCLSNTTSVPFSFIRRSRDIGRQFAASFSLSPDEKIFGCGESFTRLNKRGQKVVLWTCDAHGVQTPEMYKPIPFYLSSRGYGVFVHSSTPMTFDFGNSYDSTTTLHVGDDMLDIFVFLGNPKEILSEYTALTGRSPMPPLWSFGLWMSRITYKSEEETRDVARLLREHRIPCDVIHLDTGWFETDWRCDYKFSPSRFDDPVKMIADLKEMGLRVSLWQLPYFTPTNPLYREAIENGYVVKNSSGAADTEDAIIDFSNPAAAEWYKGLLGALLKIGVGAIKVDFGESGPLEGIYASGRTGWYEHNLYPLRYNKAASEITSEVTGESIIWARSAWAGSQRYPLHWGGDAENTDGAMASSLRSGLSFGLCGFSFWSHDIGGFVQKSPEAIYRRWLPFGMLTSHSRCHGAPPKEPWNYNESFTDAFRLSTELKYKLMPYIINQAKISSENGWPMLRTLFFEYPCDPTSWLIEDEYLFGQDILVAPLMEETTDRGVYCPPGTWVDYQTGQKYTGSQWHNIAAGDIPCVILIRSGATIPFIPVAQCTDQIDWSKVENVKY
ncbi:MAG: TIM-barrel domain-containing protein [bacterium]